MFVILSLVSCFMFIILKYVFITHTVLFLHVFSYINDIILYVFHVFSNFIYIYKRYYITWASLVAQRVKNLPAMRETGVGSLGREDPLEKGMATHSSIVAWRIPWTEELGGLQSMGSQRVRQACETNTHTHHIMYPYAGMAMAPHSSTLAWEIPWTEEPGRLQSMDGVAKSRTRPSDFTFTSHFHALEKEMATRSSVLAWRIPGTGEPGGLPSMRSHRVGHD